VIGMRVTWDKRYITLGPVCTILGLAFHLFDPDGLLGDKKHIGITCALVPRDTPGAEIGRRHVPLERHVHERSDAWQGRVHAPGLRDRRSGQWSGRAGGC
jgi:alkylation response protein AidB-like acyl-CoA dehydrogenase